MVLATYACFERCALCFFWGKGGTCTNYIDRQDRCTYLRYTKSYVATHASRPVHAYDDIIFFFWNSLKMNEKYLKKYLLVFFLLLSLETAVATLILWDLSTLKSINRKILRHSSTDLKKFNRHLTGFRRKPEVWTRSIMSYIKASRKSLLNFYCFKFTLWLWQFLPYLYLHTKKMESDKTNE